MYETFYGLMEKPFSILPDPDFLYMSKKHESVLTMLEYGIENHTAGFTVITGEIGSGKTTLIRRLLDNIGDSESLNIALLSNTHAAFGDLMEWMCMSFSLDYRKKSKVELHELFENFVISEYARGKKAVLIVDEAQNLTDSMMEELRMLSNINNYKDELVNIVLVGQPELKQRLQQPNMKQFVQRITSSYHLSALNREETRAYIQHRLSVAGADRELFDDKAMDAIWYFSKGVPRLINNICDSALVYGFAEDMSEIHLVNVVEVIKDKKQAGMNPLSPN